MSITTMPHRASPRSVAAFASPRTARSSAAASRAAWRARAFTSFAGALATCFAIACGGGGGAGQIADQAPGQIGQPATKNDGGGLYDGNLYLVDPHSGGKSNEFLLTGAAWGRLVDIYDFDSATGEANLVYPEFVVGQDVRTEPGKWTLETNPATGVTRLTLLVKNTAALGDAFDLLVQEARNNLSPVAPKSLQPGELPPFPLIARNSVLELRFNDLVAVDTALIHDTVKVLTGNPPSVPFDARIVPSSNHGGVIGGQFHPTRILVDMTVSEFEAASASGLALNGIGLPASLSVTQPNVVVRFPTQVNPSAGQFKLLRNLKGEALAQNGNGPLANTPTLDVERAMRSGSGSDANNGFLLDLEAPRLVSQQSVVVTSAVADPDPNAVPGFDFIVGFAFQTPACGFNPIVGDALLYGSNLAIDVRQAGSVGAGGSVVGLRVRAPLIGDPVQAADLLGPASFLTPYRAELASQAGCFLNFSPASKEPPTGAVPPNATVTVRFSEPMDPMRVRPFDSFRIVRLASGQTLTFRDYIVGEVVPLAGQREFRFEPSLDFEHAQNNQAYFVDILTGPTLLTDLAGNPLQAAPPQIQFRVDPTAAPVVSKGWVLRFANPNLQEAGAAGTDLRGQFLYDQTGFIRPRIPVRFPAIADRGQPMIGKMQPVTTGVVTPLSALGSKLQHVWRYPDFGFSISETDDSLMNLDVEGVALAPISGQVITAMFPLFEIRLAHSNFLPDELIDPVQVVPVYPNSGLKSNWTANLLNDPVGGQKVVHDRAKGFAVAPSEVFQSVSGTPMLRMPLNIDATSDAEKQWYTWRDTAVLAKGGMFQSNYVASVGVPFAEEQLQLGLPATVLFSSDNPPPTGGLPSVGLPLLVEYRCFPTETVSLNQFDVSIASTSTTSTNPLIGFPKFRAFATGGVDAAGQVQTVNPDLVPNAEVGGYSGNPAIAPLGTPLPGTDPVVYIGQADVVLRISRVYTRVIDALGTTPTDLRYRDVVVEPANESQPAGTSVVLAWRGSQGSPGGTNADLLDVYGDVLAQDNTGALASLPWLNQAQLFAAEDLRFLQTRITFISNTATQLSPVLDSYGLAFTN